MVIRSCLALMLALVLVVICRKKPVLGAKYRDWMCAVVVMLLCGAWLLVDRKQDGDGPAEPPEAPGSEAAAGPPPSEACVDCHKARHASWYRSYHRTMTREATPENVKADFNDAVYRYMGFTSRLSRRGDRFFLETVDPVWVSLKGLQGIPFDRAGPPPRREFTVDRVVGSHWFQQMLHRDEEGRYIRLPLIYHIVERRWIHANGAFLSPENPNFYGTTAVWNESCVFCHNTRPAKNPVPVPGAPAGYRTQVAELGISCEACHGPGDRHILAHQGQERAAPPRDAPGGDPTIVNPARLSVQRADDICAHCHGAGPRPIFEAWDPNRQADPFQPGEELARTHFLFWSEAQLSRRYPGKNLIPKDEIDGRFWSDGTPLTTALEYQGMALSKCYQGGEGKMSCLSCHSLHGADPNHQLKPGARTNESCYSCHEQYRNKLTEHTHHAADSSGSLCHNCHMPHHVYSLLDTHRSHRITVPRVRDSVATGRPHACNLCHLDKSLGWTADRLQAWYKTRPERLSEEDRTVAAGVLHLLRGDVRSRVLITGALSREPAQQASGRDWPGLLLLAALEKEQYPAARYLAHRALRSLHAPAAGQYEYLGDPAQRAEQVQKLRTSLLGLPRPDPKRYPYLPLTPEGLFSDAGLDRLLRDRKDPRIDVHE